MKCFCMNIVPICCTLIHQGLVRIQWTVMIAQEEDASDLLKIFQIRLISNDNPLKLKTFSISMVSNAHLPANFVLS